MNIGNVYLRRGALIATAPIVLAAVIPCALLDFLWGGARYAGQEVRDTWRMLRDDVSDIWRA